MSVVVTRYAQGGTLVFVPCPVCDEDWILERQSHRAVGYDALELVKACRHNCNVTTEEIIAIAERWI